MEERDAVDAHPAGWADPYVFFVHFDDVWDHYLSEFSVLSFTDLSVLVADSYVALKKRLIPILADDPRFENESGPIGLAHAEQELGSYFPGASEADRIGFAAAWAIAEMTKESYVTKAQLELHWPRVLDAAFQPVPMKDMRLRTALASRMAKLRPPPPMSKLTRAERRRGAGVDTTDAGGASLILTADEQTLLRKQPYRWASPEVFLKHMDHVWLRYAKSPTAETMPHSALLVYVHDMIAHAQQLIRAMLPKGAREGDRQFAVLSKKLIPGNPYSVPDQVKRVMAYFVFYLDPDRSGSIKREFFVRYFPSVYLRLFDWQQRFSHAHAPVVLDASLSAVANTLVPTVSASSSSAAAASSATAASAAAEDVMGYAAFSEPEPELTRRTSALKPSIKSSSTLSVDSAHTRGRSRDDAGGRPSSPSRSRSRVSFVGVPPSVSSSGLGSRRGDRFSGAAGPGAAAGAPATAGGPRGSVLTRGSVVAPGHRRTDSKETMPVAAAGPPVTGAGRGRGSALLTSPSPATRNRSLAAGGTMGMASPSGTTSGGSSMLQFVFPSVLLSMQQLPLPAHTLLLPPLEKPSAPAEASPELASVPTEGRAFSAYPADLAATERLARRLQDEAQLAALARERLRRAIVFCASTLTPDIVLATVPLAAFKNILVLVNAAAQRRAAETAAAETAAANLAAAAARAKAAREKEREKEREASRIAASTSVATPVAPTTTTSTGASVAGPSTTKTAAPASTISLVLPAGSATTMALAPSPRVASATSAPSAAAGTGGGSASTSVAGPAVGPVPSGTTSTAASASPELARIGGGANTLGSFRALERGSLLRLHTKDGHGHTRGPSLGETEFAAYVAAAAASADDGDDSDDEGAGTRGKASARADAVPETVTEADNEADSETTAQSAAQSRAPSQAGTAALSKPDQLESRGDSLPEKDGVEAEDEGADSDRDDADTPAEAPEADTKAPRDDDKDDDGDGGDADNGDANDGGADDSRGNSDAKDAGVATSADPANNAAPSESKTTSLDDDRGVIITAGVGVFGRELPPSSPQQDAADSAKVDAGLDVFMQQKAYAQRMRQADEGSTVASAGPALPPPDWVRELEFAATASSADAAAEAAASTAMLARIGVRGEVAILQRPPFAKLHPVFAAIRAVMEDGGVAPAAASLVFPDADLFPEDPVSVLYAKEAKDARVAVFTKWTAHMLAFTIERDVSGLSHEALSHVRDCLSPLRLEPPNKIASNVMVGKEVGHTNRLVQAATILAATLLKAASRSED
jgi:hypothetical protein